MAPAAIPFICWPIKAAVPVPAALRVLIALLLGAGFTVALFRRSPTLLRQEEHGLGPNIVGYVVPVVLCVSLFPRDLEIGFTVLVLLAVGDGSATLFGLVFPGRRLPWNRRKTWAGTLACAVLGGIASAWVLHAYTDASWRLALGYGLGLGAATGIVESLPRSENDNARVGVVDSILAALTIAILQHYGLRTEGKVLP
jgi:dolichol kinase